MVTTTISSLKNLPTKLTGTLFFHSNTLISHWIKLLKTFWPEVLADQQLTTCGSPLNCHFPPIR